MTDTTTQAFPFAATDPSNVNLQSSGMNLRDYFAAKAIPELMRLAVEDPDVGESAGCGIVAKMAYNVADAMMEARK